MVIEEENEEIKKTLIYEEVKNMIFDLNANSASGLDDFLEKFFQSCLEVIGTDITNMVKEFFIGMTYLSM